MAQTLFFRGLRSTSFQPVQVPSRIADLQLRGLRQPTAFHPTYHIWLAQTPLFGVCELLAFKQYKSLRESQTSNYEVCASLSRLTQTSKNRGLRQPTAFYAPAYSSTSPQSSPPGR
jgi:hypothetical protein